MSIELLNIDCMKYMATLPDKAFDLAIVDPPYGIGEDGSRGNVATDKWKNPRPSLHTVKKWDNKKPDEAYWQELFRVSRNQIVWGGNYFTEFLPPKMGWIYWDKKTGDSDYSDGELAWTSFDKALRSFSWLWSGFKQEVVEKRIHPTQKPVQLYKWILKNYAHQYTNFNPRPGDRILDTHLGSGSSAIAAHQMGFDFVGCEIDKDYYTAACKRFKEQTMQQSLFKP